MRALLVFLQAIVGLAIIAAIWLAAAALWQDPNKLPPLQATFNRAIELATSEDYRQHFNASAQVLLWGLLPAVIAGILLGVLAGISGVLRWLFGSLFMTIGAAPLVALMSLLLLWLGLGPNVTAIAVAIIVMFPVANAVMMSLATRQSTIALAVVRGLHWGVVLGATALVIAEMLIARLGTAKYIMNAGSQFETLNVVAGTALLFVPVIALAVVLQAIEEQLAG